MIIRQNYEKKNIGAFMEIPNRYDRLCVCGCGFPLFVLGATGTRQIWWFYTELNYKTSDQEILVLAHLFPDIGLQRYQNWDKTWANRAETQHFWEFFFCSPNSKTSKESIKIKKTINSIVLRTKDYWRNFYGRI